MKNTIIIIIVFIISVSASAQISSVGIRGEFKTISGLGHRQTGFEGIQTYHSGNVKGSQFFSDSWNTGSVITTNNEKISNGYLFLYDNVRQELFIRPTDSAIILLADKNQIFSFTINTDKPHMFEQAYTYDSALKGNFFEVLVQSSNYSLMKLIKTTFEKANYADMEKVKQGEFSDEFLDHITYYLYHNSKLTKINLRENSLRKALKERQSEVDNFFNLHQNDEMNEQLLISLISSINS